MYRLRSVHNVLMKNRRNIESVVRGDGRLRTVIRQLSNVNVGYRDTFIFGDSTFFFLKKRHDLRIPAPRPRIGTIASNPEHYTVVAISNVCF